MTKLRDITGGVFGRLTVLEALPPIPNRKRRWLCLCQCGKQVSICGNDLKSGDIRSCGCLRSEVTKAKMTQHGMAKTPIWGIWQNMLNRCHRPTTPSYHNYGGRGITVCERWHTFENFFADMGYRPHGKTLDRINNDGNYEPGNCRWATLSEQSSNTRFNHHITIGRKTMILARWAEKSGLDQSLIRDRLKRGWPPKKAVFTPARNMGRKRHE